MNRALLTKPGEGRRLMLRAKKYGDLLLAMEADAHAVLEGIRTGNARAALLPQEDHVATQVAAKALANSFQVQS